MHKGQTVQTDNGDYGTIVGFMVRHLEDGRIYSHADVAPAACPNCGDPVDEYVDDDPACSAACRGELLRQADH